MDVGELVWIACLLAHLCERFKLVSHCKASLLCCTLYKVKGPLEDNRKKTSSINARRFGPSVDVLHGAFLLLLTGLSVFMYLH